MIITVAIIIMIIAVRITVINSPGGICNLIIIERYKKKQNYDYAFRKIHRFRY